MKEKGYCRPGLGDRVCSALSQMGPNAASYD
jgi:hypothetical protein